MGTPLQTIDVQLDTGSSDFWLVSNSDLIDTPWGKFDKDASTSQEPVFTKESVGSDKPVQQSFRVDYIDGNGVIGLAYKDSVVIGGHSVPGVQFGLASKSQGGFGILGLGFAEAQSAVRFNRGPSYPSLLQTLVNQKTIRAKAFSLWLGDENGSTGSILFGGVDTAKFEGDLTTLSLQASDDYKVHADAISFRKSSSVLKSFSGAVLIDSGHTFSYLPDDLVDLIWKETKAQLYSPDPSAPRLYNVVPFVDCDSSSSMTLDFNFGTTKIQVPISKFTYANANPPPNGPQCLLAILPQIRLYKKGRGQPVLGGKFLEIAYVVHDLDNHEISIAQAKSGAASAVVELGPDGVKALHLGGSRDTPRDKELDPEAVDAEEETLAPTTPSSDSGSTSESEVREGSGSGEPQGSNPGAPSIIGNEGNPGEAGVKDTASLPLSPTSPDASKAETQAPGSSLFYETNPSENLSASSDGTQVSDVPASKGVDTVSAAPGGFVKPSFLSFNPPSPADRGASLFDGTEDSEPPLMARFLQ